MQINWFTVIAQIINFIILVWLLKRYLYKPILNAIDEREKKIVVQITDADAKKAEAKKEQDEFKAKIEKFDQEKKALMDKAIAETNATREKLLAEAKAAADILRTKQEQAITDKQEELNKDIAGKAQTGVFAIARKVLGELASVSLEEQSAVVFIKKLAALNGEEKKQFIDAFKSSSSPVMVKSSFALPEKQKTDLASAVGNIIGAGTPCQFQQDGALVSGIELTANGYKLSWSISGYLKSLEKSIAESTNEKTMAETEKK